MKRTQATAASALTLAVILSAIPLPVAALGPPRTLTAERSLGAIDGTGPLVDPTFPVDYLGLSWALGPLPSVRFRSADGDWGAWTRVHEDDVPAPGGRTWSALVFADDADAYQVRGRIHAVRAVALNTTDGPRTLVCDE